METEELDLFHVEYVPLVSELIRALYRNGFILTNKSPATHGMVGFLGTCGTLDQIGYAHLGQ